MSENQGDRRGSDSGRWAIGVDNRRALNIASERYRCRQTIRISTSGIPESLGVPSMGGTEGRTDAAGESGARTGGTPDDAGPFTDAPG